jgi:uncharacterized membrane protein YgdD (TMEM256/DUF423 family)
MNLWLGVGALLGFAGVAAGAFGAHALRSRLAPDLLAVFEVGVRYQMYHALALLLLGLWGTRLGAGSLRLAGLCFTGGVLVFSGSLYALALSGQRWLGAVTPLGGLLFLAGGVVLVVAAWGGRG